jgi:hypothetical protein
MTEPQAQHICHKYKKKDLASNDHPVLLGLHCSPSFSQCPEAEVIVWAIFLHELHYHMTKKSLFLANELGQKLHVQVHSDRTHFLPLLRLDPEPKFGMWNNNVKISKHPVII